MLVFSDRKEVRYASAEADVDMLLRFINERNEHTLIGFFQDWKRLYSYNYNKFIDLLIQNEQERLKRNGKPPINEEERRNRYLRSYNTAAKGKSG